MPKAVTTTVRPVVITATAILLLRRPSACSRIPWRALTEIVPRPGRQVLRQFCVGSPDMGHTSTETGMALDVSEATGRTLTSTKS